MKKLCLIPALLLVAPSAFSQQPALGFPPFGSFQDGRFDAINRENLNVNFSIPIVSVPGRGLNFSFALTHNSLVWSRTNVGYGILYWTVTGGWNLAPGLERLIWDREIVTCGDSQEEAQHFFNFRSQEQDGTIHTYNDEFYDVATACAFPTDRNLTHADDGSGFMLDTNLMLAYDRSGTIRGAGVQFKDTNGNYIPWGPVYAGQVPWTDSLGRAVLKIVPYTDHADYQYLDINGSYKTVQVYFTTFNVRTNFGCAGVGEYNGSWQLPTSILLPNGQTYSFTYQDTPGFPGYTTARMKRVTLPTGGYYEYRYPQTPNNGINCSDGTVTSLTRDVNDGASTYTWQYSRTKLQDDASARVWQTLVTAPLLTYDPAANQATYTFTTSLQTATKEIPEKQYQGSASSGQLLLTIDTSFGCSGQCFPSTKIVTLPNNQQSKVETDYNAVLGNLLETREYDWGTGAPGPLVRRTTYTYLLSSPYFWRNINRPTQIIVKDGGGTIRSRTDFFYDTTSLQCITGALQHDDTGYGCTFTTRGNLTAITSYTDPVTPSGAVTETRSYDSLGNLVSATDSGGHTTNFSYADNYSDGVNRSSFAYLTQTTKPAPFNSQTLSSKYYFSNGLQASVTDENGRVTSFSYLDALGNPDPFGRLRQATSPDGGQTTISYDDPNRTVTTTQKRTSSDNLTTVEVYNQLGQLAQRQMPGGRKVAFTYDALGRSWKDTNPYVSTADSTYGVTETRYDALGRVARVIKPDASYSILEYSGSAVRATDETGKQLLSDTDSLGRQTKTCEVTAGNSRSPSESCGITGYGGTGYLTTAVYDALDNVTQSTQGVQTRTASFDGLGRITQAKILEVSTSTNMVYAYDNNGNLRSVADPRGTVSFEYDALNRQTRKKQNGVAVASFTYDGAAANNAIGRLIAERDGDFGSGADETDYTYDAVGRALTANRILSATTYAMTYAYDYLGNPTSVSYPSSSGTRRLIQYAFNSAGELNRVTDATTPGANFDYVTAATFSPLGSLASISFGNAVQTSVSWTPRAWLNTLVTQKTGGSTYFSLAYTYAINGRITQITNALNGAKSEKYTYDDLNRLLTAQLGPDASIVRKYHYDYDRYGNRWGQNVIAGSGYGGQNSFDTAANRLTSTGFTYDGSGNITASGGGTSFTYDAENFMTAAGSTTYKYDAEGRRVRKTVSGVATDYFYSGSEIIAEKTGSTWTDYVFFGDQRIVQQNGTTAATAIYLHTDHLGSTRVCTDGNGNSAGICDHEPFGEVQVNSTCSVPTSFRFAGMQFDQETGLYHTWFRQFDPNQARWMSVDPRPGSLENPQSHNRYPYVFSDPMNNTDVFGLQPSCVILVDGLPTDCGSFLKRYATQLFDLLYEAFAVTRTVTVPDPDCKYPDDCGKIDIPFFDSWSLLAILDIGPQKPDRPKYTDCVDANPLVKPSDEIGLFALLAGHPVKTLVKGVAEHGAPFTVKRMASTTAGNLEASLEPSAARQGLNIRTNPFAIDHPGPLVNSLNRARSLAKVSGMIGKVSGWVTLGATASSATIRGTCAAVSRGLL